MAYTKRKKTEYKKIFNDSPKFDDYVYQRMHFYKEETFIHYILLEFYLRIENFKTIYKECYKNISDEFETSKSFPLNGYQELKKYSNEFQKYGYDIFEITKYIHQELCLKNIIQPENPYLKKEEFSLKNIFNENSISYTPSQNKIQIIDNPFTKGTKNKDGSDTQEYKNFIEEFNIYRFNYDIPTNKHFLKDNSINVNLFLSPLDKENDIQIKHLYNLIKEFNDNNMDEYKSFCKLSKIEIIMHFYVYDLSKKKIPSSKIKDFTKNYVTSNDFIERIKHAETKIDAITNKLEDIKSKISKLIEKETNSTKDIIDLENDINQIIDGLLDIKLLCYNQLKRIDKFIFMYEDILATIDRKYNELQVSEAKELIKKNPEEEDYWTNNYDKIYFDNVKLNFKSIFSLFDYDNGKVLKSNIIALENIYKKNIDTFKSKFETIKIETINKYIKNIESILKNTYYK